MKNAQFIQKKVPSTKWEKFAEGDMTPRSLVGEGRISWQWNTV